MPELVSLNTQGIDLTPGFNALAQGQQSNVQNAFNDFSKLRYFNETFT